MEIRQVLEEGRTALGVELGSTRVKAVLVDGENRPIASGSVDWENRYENGIWTYSLDEIERSVRDCYARLAQDVLKRYGVTLKKIGAIGISAMMHGYMAFDGRGALLTPFRTWRNNGAARAAERLTEAFGRHIPARWSVAHLYQAILDREPHVRKIARLFTLAG
ncbi:MAG: FGGY family carbohydrate kinase, partial [Candidatus Gallimonas sp.]